MGSIQRQSRKLDSTRFQTCLRGRDSSVSGVFGSLLSRWCDGLVAQSVVCWAGCSIGGVFGSLLSRWYVWFAAKSVMWWAGCSVDGVLGSLLSRWCVGLATQSVMCWARCSHRLVGLVVKACASRAEDPGFESRLRRDFFGVESYQRLKNRHSSSYPGRRMALYGQCWDWFVRCQYTVTG